MSRSLDLNELRNHVLNNQREGNSSRPVHVDREGKITTNPQAAHQPNLSKVPQQTFAYSLHRDRQIAAEYLPANTQEMQFNGVTGWLYQIQCQLENQYLMVAYYDGELYQVMVVFPDVAGKYDQHDGHLYDDGRICFGSEGGLPTLQDAFAKSVLWATGFSIFLQTGQFSFSINNY
ncbi:hypothetical protein NIES267_41770 [Calothrix parasitica NIES-267]|uniref:Uncharacterized protein n=1 Tax=Calothrix parasitica NIES-267 TaxID=1973488 RepID=A0A1Z4LU49_9CYAN|nr:hypothetical protein NIES267_41770 [Calothrix parasitica NIES-267]